jgi:hypothetical protein
MAVAVVSSKPDGEFVLDIGIGYTPGDHLYVSVDSSTDIEPDKLRARFVVERGEWVLSAVTVYGKVWRKDKTLGSRRAETFFTGPLDETFEGPGWLTGMLKRELASKLAAARAVETPVKERSPQRASFETALNVLLIKENLDGAEWALQQILDEAEILDGGPGLGDTAVAEYLRTLVEKVSGGLDKRTAELATREN